MRVEKEMMRGAGPMAVMQILAAGEAYGYELIEAVTQRTRGVLAMGQSTLYPLLYNLEAKGLIKSRLDESSPRPRRYYRLTDKGRRKLAQDTKRWQALTQAMESLGLGAQPAAEGGSI